MTPNEKVYTDRVIERTAATWKPSGNLLSYEEVMSALERTPEITAAMRRVFQIANRRVQNIERASEDNEIYSPAYESLGDILQKQGFSKFSFSGYSFDELKEEYSKAIGFISSPTSTLEGTRQYNERIKSKYSLDGTAFSNILENMKNNQGGVLSTFERYFSNSKQIARDFEVEVNSSSTQIESEAVATETDTQARLNAAADEILQKEIQKHIEDELAKLGA